MIKQKSKKKSSSHSWNKREKDSGRATPKMKKEREKWFQIKADGEVGKDKKEDSNSSSNSTNERLLGSAVTSEGWMSQ